MIQVHRADLRVLDVRTRLPFRYGIATLDACPHLFAKLTLDVDGRRVTGLAADHLPPKWFTKDPHTTYPQDLKEMTDLIGHAADHAVLAGPHPSLYSLISSIYLAQSIRGREKRIAPLLYGHGVSLVERAAIEAFCKAKNAPFATALRENLLGIQFSGFADQRLMLDLPELGDSRPAGWLPKTPLRRITVRHTVGLADPLTDADIAPGGRVDDGLPQTLEENIRAYRLRHFKLKLAGRAEEDLPRLKQIFEIIAAGAIDRDWRFSLDGNENYAQIEPFMRLWHALEEDPALAEPLRHLVFIEQPLHRDAALSDAALRELTAWKDRPPIIIDESDDRPGALGRALECGYAGTSHKNCKGIIKGIANACLLEYHRQQQPGRTFILSGEDLSNIGPIALLQDLAVSASLGIESIERNGHHYFRGVSMFSPEVQEQVLAHHGDLYHRRPRGFATLRIEDGGLDIGSLLNAPLGPAFDLDISRFTPLNEWHFDPDAV